MAGVPSELPGEAPGNREEIGAVRRLRVLAARQYGIFTAAQAAECSVKRSALSRAVESMRLFRLHRGVYSTVAPELLNVVAFVVAALFAAGKGAALSHATAAWWWGIGPRPRRIHVSVPKDRQQPEGVQLHQRRHTNVTRHNRLPVTTIPQTLLDQATELPHNELRRALAEAEYRWNVHPEDVEPVLRRGHPGSTALRRALKAHMPQLAKTRSNLEREFLFLCERFGIPLPEVNERIGHKRVDAVWHEQRLAVELDGGPGHAGRRRRVRDLKRELHTRRAGYRIIRYDWAQIMEEPELVAEDLRRELGLPAHHAA